MTQWAIPNGYPRGPNGYIGSCEATVNQFVGCWVTADFAAAAAAVTVADVAAAADAAVAAVDDGAAASPYWAIAASLTASLISADWAYRYTLCEAMSEAMKL